VHKRFKNERIPKQKIHIKMSSQYGFEKFEEFEDQFTDSMNRTIESVQKDMDKFKSDEDHGLF
jgi:hypothetical protein